MLRFIELEIPSYALMTVVGIIVAVYFLYCRCEAFGVSLRQLLLYSVLVIAGMALGSRVVFVVSQIPVAIQQQSWWWIWRAVISGGFVFYGGLFGALLGVLAVSRLRKIPTGHLMNFYIVGFPVFHFFGRIGCFLAGCCYGVPVSWGIVMPEVDSVARMPVQLMEAVYNLIIVVVLLMVEGKCRKQGRKYHLPAVYLAMYAPFRFVIEFFRGDALRGQFGVFSTSQWISLMVIVALIARKILSVIRQNKEKTQESSIMT